MNSLSTMQYFDPYNPPQGMYPQHVGYVQPNMAQEYPSYVDQHNQQRMYGMPRRAQSMSNITQLVNNQQGEKNDTKPRLSKQEVEILERQFQEQHKPSSNTKRQIAERFQVDVSRINNWFQNRRAKAKHERRHEEEGIAQAAHHRTYSDPPSPGNFAQDGYSSDTQFQSPASQSTGFAVQNGSLPAATAPCNVRYENPIEASRNSMQRTFFEAERGAVERGEISSEEFQDEVAEDHFGAGLDLTNHGVQIASHAQFPMQSEEPANHGFSFMPEHVFDNMYTMDQMAHQPMAVQDTSSEVFENMFTSSPEHHGSIDGTMTTFPSQLLPGTHDVSELTPRPFHTQAFSPVSLEQSQSPPGGAMDSRLMSPPPAPAVPIAHRRRKHLPAAIGTVAVKDKSSCGPKTCNIPRPNASPLSLRRVSSFSNNTISATKSGRVQKATSYLPQRSPLVRQFSEGGVPFLERNASNVQHMPMPLLSATTANWNQLSPPTPNSPREMLLAQQYEKSMQQETGVQHPTYVENHKAASSSPPESEQGYTFNRQASNFFTLNAINTNMASPPETPSHPGSQQHWGYDVPDDALLTPGLFGNFSLDGLHHPQPHYVSPLTCSQPPTPAFPQFTGFPYHASPVIELTDNADMDFNNQYYSESGSSISSYPTVSSTHSSPEVAKNDKVYQFNNATPKDFEQTI